MRHPDDLDREESAAIRFDWIQYDWREKITFFFTLFPPPPTQFYSRAIRFEEVMKRAK